MIKRLLWLPLLVLLAGCGGGTTASSTTGHGAGNPEPTTLPAAKPLELVGPASVVSNTVGGSGTEYVVVFKVKNPNADQEAVNVPYTVTMKKGDVVFGMEQQVVNIEANTTRVVAHASPYKLPEWEQAEVTAEVKLFSDPSLFVPEDGANNQSQWELANLQCSQEGNLEATANGELTWKGTQPKQGVNVTLVVYQGGLDGPIVAAGTGSPQGQGIQPGQTMPVEVILVGFEQPNGYGTSTVVPDGPLSFEWYVDVSSF